MMSQSSRIGLVLLCGGSGQRMDGSVPDKALEPLEDKPVFGWSLWAFAATNFIGEAVLVVRDQAQRTAVQAWLDQNPLPFPARFTFGGAARQESVQRGLEALSPTVTMVVIHDSARPLARPEQIRRVMEAASIHGAASLAHRVKDTITRSSHPTGEDTHLLETLPREHLWAMETPQAFQLPLLRRIREEANWSDRAFTDDTAAFARLKRKVAIVENPYPNPKLTYPGDWIVVRALARTVPFRQCPG